MVKEEENRSRKATAGAAQPCWFEQSLDNRRDSTNLGHVHTKGDHGVYPRELPRHPLGVHWARDTRCSRGISSHFSGLRGRLPETRRSSSSVPATVMVAKVSTSSTKTHWGTLATTRSLSGGS
uniref:Uncharacterized protein n=1 Tax=Octactis speculum TaxID=3111310 RepID=A0A7S2CQX9_9STRA|mmetsp:Transcript_38714/g.52489  ORF Transcript_38714/g.52489 Transcript_38714/m.52489 type:complete len:123 (+) Transcript_38714:312-680(+)